MARPDKRFYTELGDDIRKKRHAKKISLRQMEDLTGLTRTTLSRYENGDPNIEGALDTICKVLCIDPDYEWETVAKQVADEQMIQDQIELEDRSGDVYIGNLTPAHQQTVKEFIDFLKGKEQK